MHDEYGSEKPRPTNLIDTHISLGQIGIVVSIVASTLIFYFTGQSNVGEHINRLESEMSTRITTGNDQLGDRISKLETRAAVLEQHQTQEDAAIADARTALNSFTVDVRQQLSRIIDQIGELRPLIQSRSSDRGNLPH